VEGALRICHLISLLALVASLGVHAHAKTQVFSSRKNTVFASHRPTFLALVRSFDHLQHPPVRVNSDAILVSAS
jgi:hypothetical protein